MERPNVRTSTQSNIGETSELLHGFPQIRKIGNGAGQHTAGGGGAATHFGGPAASAADNVWPITGRAGAAPRSTDRNDTAGPVRCIGGLSGGRTAYPKSM